jgi:amidase
MNRRKFIRNTSLTGLLVPATGIALLATPYNRATSGDDFDFFEATIDELRQGMKSGKFSARSITEAYLKRIKEIDAGGPNLNTIIELNPEALSIADQLDAERKAGRLRGPMHGIPVLVKDNINSGDQMMTTAGSLALLGHKASRDAFIVKRLREAGAVLIGKTNLSEWSNWRGYYSVSGWSSRGGLTRNPYILDRNPSGSSSGSAVAVSANFCAVAVGTETDGSIVSPASHNGVVGIKPTVGLLSRTGIVPISKTQDTAGPFARTVADAAILLAALAGIDEDDSATNDAKRKAPADYTAFLDINGLAGKRIGIEKSALVARVKLADLFKAATEVLKSKGATIVEIDFLKKFEPFGHAERTILTYEFKDGINKYLSNENAEMKSLSDVIAFNKAHAGKVMPWFGQEQLENCNSLGDLSTKKYLDALAARRRAQDVFNELMKNQKLDAICGPTTGFPASIDLVNGDADNGFYFGSPSAFTGYPHISVPMGVADGLPAGISFIAGAYKEPELIAIAHAYERASKKRAHPKFLKSNLPGNA